MKPMPGLNVGKEVAALERLPVAGLRSRYAEVFGEPTRAGNRVWLVRRIAWRLQALAEGDLTERARRRAAELARDADLRVTAPKGAPGSAPAVAVPAAAGGDEPVRFADDRRLPPAGALLVREYKGRSLRVKVLAKGFEYEGEVYRSLSAVAKAVTGSHCNGYLFFRLAGGEGRRR